MKEYLVNMNNPELQQAFSDTRVMGRDIDLDNGLNFNVLEILDKEKSLMDKAFENGRDKFWEDYLEDLQFEMPEEQTAPHLDFTNADQYGYWQDLSDEEIQELVLLDKENCDDSDDVIYDDPTYEGPDPPPPTEEEFIKTREKLDKVHETLKKNNLETKTVMIKRGEKLAKRRSKLREELVKEFNLGDKLVEEFTEEDKAKVIEIDKKLAEVGEIEEVPGVLFYEYEYLEEEGVIEKEKKKEVVVEEEKKEKKKRKRKKRKIK